VSEGFKIGFKKRLRIIWWFQLLFVYLYQVKQLKIRNMEIVIIIKTIQNDDYEASVTKEIKVCSSVEAAKKTIIKELQDDFELDEECDTFAKIACELSESGIMSRVSGNGKNDSIWWYDNDNDKGEQFDIIPMNDSEDYYEI
jgi:hypothetical protein